MKFWLSVLVAILLAIFIENTAHAARYRHVVQFSGKDSVQVSKPQEPVAEVSPEQVKAAQSHKARTEAVDLELMDLDKN